MAWWSIREEEAGSDIEVEHHVEEEVDHRLGRGA